MKEELESNTPKEYRLPITEYICAECNNEFFVAEERTKMMICPRAFCGGEAEPVKSWTAYFREIKEETK